MDDEFELQLAIAMSESLHATPVPPPVTAAAQGKGNGKSNNTQESAFFSDEPLPAKTLASISSSSGTTNGNNRNPPFVRTSGFQVMGGGGGAAATASAAASDALSSAQPKSSQSKASSTNNAKKSEGASSSLKSNGGSSSSSSGILGAFGSLRSAMENAAKSASPWCSGCNTSIGPGCAYITAMSNTYHKACFTCSGCHQLIDGSFVPKGSPPAPYHERCATELFNPRCTVCSCAIHGQYYKHPFFENETYCITHDGQRTCFACNRKEPFKSTMKDPFTDLPDGRTLCAECVGSVIMDSSEAKNIYLKVVDFMQYSLGFVIPPEMRDIPILAVEIQALNENLSHSFHAGMGGGMSGGTTRGMTMSNLREVKHFAVRGMPSSLYKVDQIRAVSVILVLFGLPADLTGSILAHEAMHAWIKLTKSFPFSLPPKIEEGLCQVIADKFLETISNSHFMRASDAMDDNEFDAMKNEDNLRASFRHQIATDASPIYGDGFRELNKATEALSLHTVLEYIKDNQKVPIV